MSERTPTPAWFPKPESIRATNLAQFMERRGIADYPALHAWSVQQRTAFWEAVVRERGIRFGQPYEQIVDLSAGVKSPRWFPGAKLNIVESCFLEAPDKPAI